VAKDWGVKVTSVGDKFLHTITRELANSVNEKFIIEDEIKVLSPGEKYFDFSSARNYAASLASNDWICCVDADEELTTLNIDMLETILEDKELAHLEYEFIFAHDQYNRPSVQFKQSKMYDRRKMQWTGLVHEMLTPITTGGKVLYLPRNIYLLEHWQNFESNRHSYLVGLAVDCYMNLEKDRNSHYFARELFWNGRPKSAIKEFKRHIEMKRWPAESAQSMIFIGDCYGMLNDPDNQIMWYSRAFKLDPNRRESLIKLAAFYDHNNVHRGTIAYAQAALTVPWTDYYANNPIHYQNYPHELLYRAYGWTGDIPKAQEHLLKALSYLPYNPDYLRDTKYYFEYPDPGIDGYMTYPELTWLYNMAKNMNSILEIGSWKGRSTHALLSGCKGKVTSVDTFEGSNDLKDWTYKQGIVQNVYDQFKENLKGFKNLEVFKMTSKEAKAKFKNRKWDMIFIDAEHTYEGVKEDIALWKNNATVILCGHDYGPGWPTVVKAVNESLGKVDIIESIWKEYIL
jgi:tetratricopeptide (TPR) repeat protein